MLKKEATAITGGLSKPSKMPGPAHNLPAWNCITGGKLQAVKGSVCAGCYAMKGRYRFKNVRAALDRRLQALTDPRWVDAMTALITGEPWFRWHDSGDIQSAQHLKNIFEGIFQPLRDTSDFAGRAFQQIDKLVEQGAVPEGVSADAARGAILAARSRQIGNIFDQFLSQVTKVLDQFIKLIGETIELSLQIGFAALTDPNSDLGNDLQRLFVDFLVFFFL